MEGQAQSPSRKQYFMDAKVTPWVYCLAKPYYPTGMDPIVPRLFELPPTSIMEWVQDIRMWMQSPANPATCQRIIHVDLDNIHPVPVTYYSSFTMNDDEYKVGDFVLVMPEGDVVGADQEVLAARFGRIISIAIASDAIDEPQAHVEWYQHGYTIFDSLASPQELFATTECSDIQLRAIRGKISVTYEHPRSSFKGESIDAIAEKNYKQGEYFWRQKYDKKTGAFSELKDDQIPNYYASNTGILAMVCDCCSRKLRNVAEETTTIAGRTQTEDGKERFSYINRPGVEYYVGDFVYLFESENEIYTVGQIEDITIEPGTRLVPSFTQDLAWYVDERQVHLTLATFDRYDDLFKTTWFEELNLGNHRVRDERRLIFNNRLSKYTADRLEGRCFVRNLNQFPTLEDLNWYKNKADNFWVESARSPTAVVSEELDLERDTIPYYRQLSSSPQTETKRREGTEQLNAYLTEGEDARLRCLDMFAGMGGLSDGFVKSGAMKVIGAVEICSSACEIYESIHPHTPMYNADGSLLLERAIRRDHGEELEYLYTVNGKAVSDDENGKSRKKGKGKVDQDARFVPDLPYRGDVQTIIGGPPCPGYSKANPYPTESNPVNALLFMHLSYCEYYRPQYFLLENVKGLLEHKLDGIAGGSMKLIQRILTGLGYHVNFAQLQAAEHGVPSTRPRVFLWAWRPGCPPPVFPQPQNLYKGGIGQSTSAVFYRQRRSAPFKAATVGDTITDLPAHEWVNPHAWVPATDADERVALHRRNVLGITQYDVPDTRNGRDIIGIDRLSYQNGPFTELQRKLRRGAGRNELRNHVTITYQSNVERVCNVPLRPNADHRDIPNVPGLKPDFLTQAALNARNDTRAGSYGRLNHDGQFRACLTAIEPSSGQGKILHPTQHRVVSVREYARAMSFPDTVVLDFSRYKVEDAIRAIGNAVPPMQSLALAVPLRDILVRVYHGNLNGQV